MSESFSYRSWSVLCALILICFVYLGYSGIENYSKTPKWIGVLVLLVVGLIIHRKHGIKWSFGLSIWSVFILQYLFQAAASYNPYDAISNSLPFIVGPLVVLGIFRSQDTLQQLSKLSVLLALISAPLIFYGLYELTDLVSSADYSRKSSYGIRFSFGHKNQLAQFFTLLVPLYALGISLVAEKWKKIVLFSSIVLIYIFVTLLMNRTSLLLLFGVYPLVFIVYLLRTQFSDARKKIIYWVFGSVILVGIFVLFIIPEQLPFIDNWMHSDSGSERLMIWQNSMELAREAPIFGHGSGDWKIEILRTSLERAGYENQLYFQRAHNEFIHRLVENGLVGTLVLAAFFIYFFIKVIRASVDFNLKSFSISGLIGFIIISSLSFPLERVELVFLLFLFVLPTFSHIESPKPIVRYSFIALAGICLIFSISWIQKERRFFVSKEDNDIDLMENLNSYTIDAVSTPVAFYKGNYYFGRQNYQKATIAFAEAYTRNPYHVHVLNNLASSQSLIGQTDKAKETYLQLFELDSLFVEGLMNAASVYFNSGDAPQALNYLMKIPREKEPENFTLFATTIVRSRLETLQSSDQPFSQKRINELLKSDDQLIALFEAIRSGKSLEAAIDTR